MNTKDAFNFSNQIELMRSSLDCAVPLKITELKKIGGPSDYHFEQVQEIGSLIAEKGDQLIFRSKETPEIFNKLVFALAVASFVPGGVKLFGLHFESKLD